MGRKRVWGMYAAVWGIAALAVVIFLPRDDDGLEVVLQLIGILGVIIAVVFMLVALMIPERWKQR